MVSASVITANRLNALKSTGPRTPGHPKHGATTMAWDNKPHSRNPYHISIHKIARRIQKVCVGPGSLGEPVSVPGCCPENQ